MRVPIILYPELRNYAEILVALGNCVTKRSERVLTYTGAGRLN